MASRGNDLSKAERLLREGRLVAIPTETVYGLAGNAYSPDAITEIFRVKDRPRFDPLILHIGRREQMGELSRDISQTVLELTRTFWPGPLTLLLPRSLRVIDLVTAGLPRVAIRMPDHPLTLELLRRLDFPLAAPSANPFGYISPTRPEHVLQQLGEQIDYVLDGGPCRVGLESTILGFESGKPVIYRKGGVSVEEIEKVTGPAEVRAHSSSNPQSPGMLKSHYAPRKPLHLGNIRDMRKKIRGTAYGILSFRENHPDHPPEQLVVLSPAGDLQEAARNLFSGLRYLDAQPVNLILAEPVPETGLGRAINDRLRRAASPDGDLK